MQHRRRLAVSSMVVMVVAAISIAAQPGQTEEAASECLSKPGAAGPPGTWWYYRVDRANNNRRCWYLGEKKERTARAERNSESAPSQRTRKSRTRKDAEAAPAPQPTPASPTSESETPPARTETRTSRNEMVSAPIDTHTARDERPSARVEMPSAEHTETGSVTNSRGNRYGTGAMVAAATPTVPALSDAEGPASAAPTTERVDPDAATVETHTATLPDSSASPESATAAVYQQSDAAPGFGHVLLFILTAAAFAAVALHMILKLRAAWLDRLQPHPEPALAPDTTASQSHPLLERSSERLTQMMQPRSAETGDKSEHAVARYRAAIAHDHADHAAALRRPVDGLTASGVRPRMQRFG